MGKKTRRLSQLLYIDFWMLLQFVFRILQPETGYPFAECHFISSLDISGMIGTVRMKYFWQFFYGKSLLDIAVCLYPVVNPLYKFCIGPRNFFLKSYWLFVMCWYSIYIVQAKWRKKQNGNNKIKKPQNESMRKYKLTLKTIINFRFWHFKNMANRTNIYERIYVSCHVGKSIA